jgi:hypothetical protein
MNLVKSCGQLFCDGSHDVGKSCPCLEWSEKAVPVFALEGHLVIEDPKALSGILIRFRSAKMAQIFVQENLLKDGPENSRSFVNSIDLMNSAEKVQNAYKKEGISWNFLAWCKPSLNSKETTVKHLFNIREHYIFPDITNDFEGFGAFWINLNVIVVIH